jgi:hypothetical protein
MHINKITKCSNLAFLTPPFLGYCNFFGNNYNNVKSNISEQTNYLQSKFTIIHPQNYNMSPLRSVTLAGLAKKYPKNGGVRKANILYHKQQNT